MRAAMMFDTPLLTPLAYGMMPARAPLLRDGARRCHAPDDTPPIPCHYFDAYARFDADAALRRAAYATITPMDAERRYFAALLLLAISFASAYAFYYWRKAR